MADEIVELNDEELPDHNTKGKLMRRLFWLGIGLAVGVLVVRKATKTARSYTPAGLAESAQQSAAGVKNSVRSFIDDVKAGAAEHEEMLLDAVAAQHQDELEERR